MKFTEKQNYSYRHLSNCIRVLAADSIEKAKSGHPGMVLGMADVMTELALECLKFNPQDPTWFNRDRLILSAGHGCMLLYTFYYLAGYINFSLTDLQQFRQLDSKTPGHPEQSSYLAVEATTGPLGQGLGNAVGMAIAQKKYQQQIGKQLCNYKIYCIVGDGCLMEGISYEAASIAGHLKLNNLVVLFDSNGISIDGKTSLTISENQLDKFKALGWDRIRVDGHDFDQIRAALQIAQKSKKPYFIVCDTLIAKGCSDSKLGSEQAHGMPLGLEEIKLLKENLNFPAQEFFIPPELKKIWENSWLRNQEEYQQWQESYSRLTAEQKSYLSAPNITDHWLEKVYLSSSEEATRASSGRVISELFKANNKVIGGSADLSASNNIKNNSSLPITADNFSGNFLHYGVREHCMGAIMNGLALSGFLPIGGTFFVFSDYMKPSIRLAALMGKQVIYIMTHDSIGVGEDGPTHQPVEHLAAMRALPNLLVLRPADCVETVECWQIALRNSSGPSMLVLTRQPVSQLRAIFKLDYNLCSYGAYIIAYGNEPTPNIAITNDKDKPLDVTIFASGSEVMIAKEAAEILRLAAFKSRVVSVPCFELFFKQDVDYIKSLLDNSRLKVAIEAGSHFGWHRIIGENGMFFGVDQFGAAAPYKDLYNHFGLSAQQIARNIATKLNQM